MVLAGPLLVAARLHQNHLDFEMRTRLENLGEVVVVPGVWVVGHSVSF